MDKPRIEELKKRRELIIKQLESKNTEIAQLKNQLSCSNSKIANYKQEIEAVKAKGNSTVISLQKKINELQVKKQEHEQHASESQSQRDSIINKLRKDVQSLASQLEGDDRVTDESVHDSTFEVDEISTQVVIRQKVLEDLYHKNEELTNLTKNLQNEISQISKKNDLLKTELFEAYELLNNTETEASSLKNSLKLFTKSTEPSLFDEVNDPRKSMHEKLLSLKKHSDDLQKQVDTKKKQLVVMCILNTDLKSVIKNHPIECQKDYNNFMLAYRNYVQTMKDLCNIVKDLALKKNQLVAKGLPDDVASFCDKLHKQQRKFEDELHEIGRAQYRSMKLKSLDIRETNTKIREEEAEIILLSSKIRENEESIEAMSNQYDEFTRKQDNVKRIDNAVKEVGEKYSKNVLVELNDNVEQRKAVKEEKMVRFDDKVNFNSDKTVRKGGRVLQYKTVIFPSKNKKK